MNILEKLSVEHPYYCSESNYYSNEPSKTYETMTEFLDCFESADVDLNLCFRWDIRNRSDDGEGKKAGRYCAQVFIMLQRKGIFKPIEIESVNEIEADRFLKYAQKHWETIKEMWKPVSGGNNA